MEKQVSALGSVSFGWLHQQGGFEFGECFFLDPLIRCEQEKTLHGFVARRFPKDPVYNIEAHLVQPEGRRRPVVLVGGLQPNLILGAAVGADFVFYGDKDPDITPTPLAEIRDFDRLAELDWASTWPISAFLDQIGELQESLGDDTAIIPPFFWDTTGRATTHGMVTTAQKLVGDRVFLELADQSSFVDELLAWVADSYATLIQRFAAAAGLTISGLHTGDCSVCMVGADVFCRSVLPHLNRLSERIGPLRLHSCGYSDHLLDAFRQVTNLDSLNVGSNTSVAGIRERFGSIRIDLLPDMRLINEGHPERVDRWVRQCIAENGDGELQFQHHLDVGQDEKTCLQIHRTLAALGVADERQEIY